MILVEDVCQDTVNTLTIIDPSQVMPRRLPSGSQLPEHCWDESMDRFICSVDAEGEVDCREIIRRLKKRFPMLHQHVISVDAVERRINVLDLKDNNYFRTGSMKACADFHARGIRLPDFNPDKYLPPKPPKPAQSQTNLSVHGIRQVNDDSQLDDGILAVAEGLESMITDTSVPMASPLTSLTDVSVHESHQTSSPIVTPIPNSFVSAVSSRTGDVTLSHVTSQSPLRSASIRTHTLPRSSSLRPPTNSAVRRAGSNSSKLSHTASNSATATATANASRVNDNTPRSQFRGNGDPTEARDSIDKVIQSPPPSPLAPAHPTDSSPSAGRRERRRPRELDLSRMQAMNPVGSTATRGEEKENVTPTGTIASNNSGSASAFKNLVARINQGNPMS